MSARSKNVRDNSCTLLAQRSGYTLKYWYSALSMKNPNDMAKRSQLDEICLFVHSNLRNSSTLARRYADNTRSFIGRIHQNIPNSAMNSTRSVCSGIAISGSRSLFTIHQPMKPCIGNPRRDPEPGDLATVALLWSLLLFLRRCECLIQLARIILKIRRRAKSPSV